MRQTTFSALIVLVAFLAGAAMSAWFLRGEARPVAPIESAAEIEPTHALAARPADDSGSQRAQIVRELLTSHGANSPVVRRHVQEWISVEGSSALDTLASDPALADLRLFASHISGLLYPDMIGERAWLHDVADIDEPSFYYAVASLASFDRLAAERLLLVAGLSEADRQALLGYLDGGGTPTPIADPEGALAAIVQDAPSAEKLSNLSALFSRLVLEDAESAISLLDQLPHDELRPAVVASMLESWATKDPAAVAHWLTEHPAHAHPDRLHLVAANWVLRDEAAALAYASRLEGALESVYLHSLVETVAIVRPESIEPWIAYNVPGRYQYGLQLHAAIRLAVTDPEIATALFDGVPADLKAAGRAELVSALAHSSVSTALRVLDAAEPRVRQELEQEVMGAIAMRAPDVALERIETWPEGAPRMYVQEMASEAISAWDPARAIAVLREIDDPAVQLRTAVSIANTLSSDQLRTVSALLGVEPQDLFRLSGSEPDHEQYN
jgi:hypothetical protein